MSVNRKQAYYGNPSDSSWSGVENFDGLRSLVLRDLRRLRGP